MLNELSRRDRKANVALKFCGCCNPQVDLGRIASSLAKIAREGKEGFQMVPLSHDDIDIVVILCGCSRACVDKEEVRVRGRKSLLVAGERVGWERVEDEQLPAAVQGELKRLLRQA